MNAPNEKPKEIDISIVLPCLNEEKAITTCLDSVQNVIKEGKLSAEVIIVDNNSSDKSVLIINEWKKSHSSLHLTLAQEKIIGYGSTCQKGFSLAKGKYVFMADLDGTYDFHDIPRFVAKLKEGYDLVVGNRFTKNIPSWQILGSMPWHHRYIGNPFLSALVRIFFGIKIKDMHCGARAIRQESLEKLCLGTTGMEFASEMIIKAGREHMSITEIPIEYRERIGTSKLKSFRDGWRHMRLILLYSPMVIFLIPGIFLSCIGLFSMIALYASTPSIFNITFYVHPLFFFSGCIIAGYQLIYFAFFAKIYAINHLGEKNRSFEKLFKYITIEKAGIVGMALFACGIAIYSFIIYRWIHSGFSSLNEIKNSILALTLLVLGVQTVSSAFMLSIISIKEK